MRPIHVCCTCCAPLVEDQVAYSSGHGSSFCSSCAPAEKDLLEAYASPAYQKWLHARREGDRRSFQEWLEERRVP